MTIIHLIRSLKYLEMEAYYCGAFAVHYWLNSFLEDHFHSNYSKASSYTTLSYTDLADASFHIGSKLI